MRSLVAIILNSAAHDKDPGRSLDILYTVLDRKNYTLSASEVRFDADGSLFGNAPFDKPNFKPCFLFYCFRRSSNFI